MSEPTEDFAAMFEASIQAKRIEKGQTIEGTIVAIGPEVAFVDVGGKGEATIEIDELKDDEGNLEVAVGDRIQAIVVSTVGGLTLSRKLVRGAATERQLEDAFHTGLPVEGKVEKAVKGGYEVRIARQRAFCPISQIDTLRTGPVGARRACLRIPDHRVQGRRQEPRRLAACPPRGAAACERRRGPAIDRRRRGDDRTRHLGARVRRVRRPRWRRAGPAARVRDGVVARVGHLAGRQARRGDHRQGPARRRRQAEDLPRVEATDRGSVVESRGHLRGRPGARRPRHACRGLRGVRRARAWRRRVGARLDVRADRAIAGVVRPWSPRG